MDEEIAYDLKFVLGKFRSVLNCVAPAFAILYSFYAYLPALIVYPSSDKVHFEKKIKIQGEILISVSKY